MTETINEKVDVVTTYKRMDKNKVMPAKIRWNGRDYLINKLGYHHRELVGKTIHHVFHVANDLLAFRLRFDTFNLTWTLEEVSDGLAN